MEGKEVCLEPVLSLGEAPEHPHLKARNTFVEFDGVVQPAPAPRFSRTVPDTPLPFRPWKADEAAQILAPWLDEAELHAARQAGLVD